MVSQLLDHGHDLARYYPLVDLAVESEIVTRRLSKEQANSMILLRLAVSGMLSKEAGKKFDSVVKAILKDD